MPLVRRRRAARLLAERLRFEDVDEAEVIETEVPRDRGRIPRSRTVQSEVHPTLAPMRLRELHPLRVAIVPGARLMSSSGAVVTARGELVLETLWDRPHWQREFDPPPELPEAKRVRGRHASLISVWCHNFHHWMFEALPRLAVLQSSGVDYDKLIVPAQLSRFHVETLELAGIPRERLLAFEGEHIQPDELVWAAPVAPFEEPTPYAIEWLRGLGAGIRGEPTERLYISRRDARRVVNEAEVLDVLRPAGFRAVTPERLSLREQIALFSSARIVVGPHGAAFSNAIFSRRLTALEFFHDRHVNVSTAAAVIAAGLEHWSLMCPRVPGLHRRRNQDLRVPVDQLAASLVAMGAAA